MPQSWETDKHTYTHDEKKEWWVKSKALAARSNELCTASYSTATNTCKITMTDLEVTGDYELVYLCSYDAEETAEEAEPAEFEIGGLLLSMANRNDEQAQYP